MTNLDIAQLAVSGVTLALVLKIILNDLHELRKMFFDHLRDHRRD